MTGLSGQCHCGAQRFTVATPPETVTACNCSICSRRGALWAYYPSEAVTLETDAGTLDAYQWGDRTMTFFHCRTCGCSVYNENPGRADDGPDPVRRRVTINARLLDEGVDLDAIPVRRLDGRNDW